MDAKKRERALSKYREANNMGDQVNVDLTYAVDFNLAVCFHANKDYQEAMDHFTGGLYSMQHAACHIQYRANEGKKVAVCVGATGVLCAD